MSALIWKMTGAGTAETAAARVTLMSRPVVAPVGAVELIYRDDAGRLLELVGDELAWRDLTPLECIDIEAFVQDSVAAAGGATVAHTVDEAGGYVGLIDINLSDRHVPMPPPWQDARWKWDGHGWRMPPTLSEAIAQAHIDIDIAAGAARARYITIAPGQEATYLLKQAQAQAFIDAGAVGSPGAFVLAEAEAMDVSPLDACTAILGQAVAWAELLGPAIEKARRRGKINAQQAENLAAVSAARDGAIDALADI